MQAKLPPMMQWRQLKIELESGEWMRFSCVTPQKIQRILAEHEIKNAYYTDAYWLNTRRLEHPTFLAQRLFLGGEITIDIDENDFTHPNSARIEASRILHFTKGRFPQLSLSRIKETGGGYHLVFSTRLPQEENPNVRFEYYKALRNAIADALKAHEFTFDEQTLRNPFQVFRLEHTRNGNKNKPCTSLDSITLPGSRKAMTRFAPLVGTTYVQSSGKNRRGDKVSGAEKSGVGAPALSLYGFFDAKVSGFKAKNPLYTPLIVMPKRERSLKRIERAARTYRHRFVVFETKNHYEALSARLVPIARYVRILRYCKATNLTSVLKTGHAKVRWTPITREDHAIIEQAPAFKTAVGEHLPRAAYGYRALKYALKFDANTPDQPRMIKPGQKKLIAFARSK